MIYLPYHGPRDQRIEDDEIPTELARQDSETMVISPADWNIYQFNLEIES